MNWLTESLQHRLAYVLVHFLWQGVVVALLLTLVVAIAGFRKPSQRYVCSLVAFLVMAACPVVTWFAPHTTVLSQHAATAAGFEFDESAALPDEDVVAHPALTPARVRDSFGPAIRPQASLTSDSNTPTALVDSGVTTFAPVATPVDEAIIEIGSTDGLWIQAIVPPVVWMWLVGVCLLSLRLLCGAIGIWRWRRTDGLPGSELAACVERLCLTMRLRIPLVRISSQVSEALAVGLLRPLVFLPATWVTELPPDMLEAVIAHELAHVRRLDLWVNLLQRIVETMLFYHPAVWWVSRRMRLEREMCCDEMAAAATVDKTRYAETLEQVALLRRKSTQPLLAVTMACGQGVLLRRVRQLLGATHSSETRGVWIAGVVTLTLAMGMTAGIAASLVDPPPQPTGTTPPTHEVSENQPSNNASKLVDEGVAPAADAPPDNAASSKQEAETTTESAVVAEEPATRKSLETRLQYARAVLEVSKQERNNSNDVNRRLPGTVPEFELHRLQRNAVKAKLGVQIAETELRRFDAVKNDQNTDKIETALVYERLQLVNRILLDAEGDLPEPRDAAVREKLAALRRPTLIRWGTAINGVQMGLELTSVKVAFVSGERIPFRFRVRNASAQRLKTRLWYSPAVSVKPTLYTNGRLIFNSSGRANQYFKVALAPGAEAVVPKTEFDFVTSGLTAGQYTIESSYLFRFGEDDDVRKLTMVRGPGWRAIPDYLPLTFTLTAGDGQVRPIATEPIREASDSFNVAWGPPILGLQSGLRYTRRLQQPGNFNNPNDWQWNDGDMVEAEVLLRNVATQSLSFSYAPGPDSDLGELTPSAHSVMPYDTYGSLQRRSSKLGVHREFRDSGRRIVRTLEPGESTVMSRTSFVLTVLAPDRKNFRGFPRTDRIGVADGGEYSFATRLYNVWNSTGTLRMSLRTGKLRLWMRLKADVDRYGDVPELDTNVAGKGRAVVRYDFPAGPDKAEIFVRQITNKRAPPAALGVFTLRSGETSKPVELPAGSYEVGRAIDVRNAGMQHWEICNAQRITVQPDKTAQIDLVRPEEKTLTIEHRVQGLSGNEAVFITVHPGDPDKWTYGEPAGSFDYRAVRTTLCATTCDRQGRFRLEALPAGRYVLAVRVFRPKADGQLALQDISLPYQISCASFTIYTDRGDDDGFVSWFPNELELFSKWDHPLWIPNRIGQPQPATD